MTPGLTVNSFFFKGGINMLNIRHCYIQFLYSYIDCITLQSMSRQNYKTHPPF